MLLTEKPVEFLAPLPKEQSAIPGDEISFEVELTKDTEDVFWFKDGKKIKPGDNVKIVKDGKKHKLIIKKVDFDDDAVYSFNAGDQKCDCNLNVSGKSAMMHMYAPATPANRPEPTDNLQNLDKIRGDLSLSSIVCRVFFSSV